MALGKQESLTSPKLTETYHVLFHVPVLCYGAKQPQKAYFKNISINLGNNVRKWIEVEPAVRRSVPGKRAIRRQS